MFQNILIEDTETASAWYDLAALYADSNAEKESWSASLGQLVWPSGYDESAVTLQFASDDTGTDPGALYDTDGTTVLSTITKPAAGQRTSLSPARFSMVKAVRLVRTGAAAQNWTFQIGIRKVT